MKRRNIGTDSVPTRKLLVVSAKWIARSAALLVIACTTPVNTLDKHPQPMRLYAREATPSHAQVTQQRFLDMFARSYFPGRTGQLLIVPREGDFITRPDQDVPYMHGSPWVYDVAIPLMFVGPAVRVGTYSMPAVQQDVAPTLAAALGVHMPPTSTGRVLPVLKTGMAPPRVVVLIVLDGMRRDYFDRYATLMPTFTALRQRGAWFTQAQLNILPSNTAVGHSTIATGTDPAVHGITGTNVYDRIGRVRREIFAGAEPGDLMALTLADVWQFATSGRAIILAQGSIDRAATPLAGHGACQLNGVPACACQLRPADGQLEHESPLLPSARIPQRGKRERAMGRRCRVDASQDRHTCCRALLSALSRVRSRRDGRHDRARARRRRRHCRSHPAQLQGCRFRGPQVRTGFAGAARHPRRDGSPPGARFSGCWRKRSATTICLP